ncbi:hypothetical protein NPIL_255201 [Nephila pilipes]|uniref:Uncharacterized protein n=1 Tax=Nephila pilipes TaxID=299642 RepID=A0A8X6QB62_NEPPI|nr:hypothetical protein NPIL_255201 [Nephila pilipes]
MILIREQDGGRGTDAAGYSDGRDCLRCEREETASREGDKLSLWWYFFYEHNAFEGNNLYQGYRYKFLFISRIENTFRILYQDLNGEGIKISKNDTEKSF